MECVYYRDDKIQFPFYNRSGPNRERERADDSEKAGDPLPDGRRSVLS